MEFEQCRQSRLCSSCGLHEERLVDAMDAAFVHGRRWIDPCRRCGAASFRFIASGTPDLSAPQLEQWARNADFLFCEQDEDLLLAQPKDLLLLLQYLDRADTPADKKRVLLSALFIMAYDQLVPRLVPVDGRLEPMRSDLGVLSRVTRALKDRKGLVEELGARSSSERVRKRVLPLLE